MKSWQLPLLQTPAEYEAAKLELVPAAFDEKIIEPRNDDNAVTFKIMQEEELHFLKRVPVYVNNRLHQSIKRVKILELQLLAWLIQKYPSAYDRVSPVPHEADGLSWGVSLITGIPHVQPRESKGYGVQGKDNYPVDGRLDHGDRVALIEGTSSTFRSILAEVLRYKQRGATVPRAHAIFTYEWGKIDLLETQGCQLEPILTVREAFKLGFEHSRVNREDYDRVTKYLLASERFYCGEFTRERAEELDLLRAGY